MRFRAVLCRTNLHKFVKINSPNYQVRALSLSHHDLAPKGFGNFKGKDSTKKTGRRKNRENSDNDEPPKKSDENPKKSENSDETPEKDEKKFEWKMEFGSGGDKDPDKNPKKPKKKKTDEKGPLDHWEFDGDPAQQWQFVAFLAMLVGAFIYEKLDYYNEVGYNQFLNELKKGSVEKVHVVNKDFALFKTRSGIDLMKFPIGSIDQLEDSLRRVQDANEVPYENRIAIQYKTTTQPFSIVTNNIFFVLIGGWLLYGRAKRGVNPMGGGMGVQMGGGAKPTGKGKKGKGRRDEPSNPFNPMGNTTKSTAQVIDPEDIDVRFKDVAGCEESKVEIMEFVNFLKHPKKYEELGAKIPKGAILNGPPGTGKTLLGKATAGEAGVTFLSVNGSEFQEMFVGVGAARVRDMFALARENSPAILFIDEIDAVGRKRGSRMGSGESDVTLNQILTEMDGFNSIDDRVVVMAATNRLDTLDSALLRPGRFDRQIYIGAPDIKGRASILKIHLKDKKMAPELSLEEAAKQLAARTPGMSGADLANVCNEGALIAARAGQKQINFIDFNRAIDRVVAGIEKKNSIMKPQEKVKVAHHEAGHAVAGWFLEHADPLVKVTIVPRGRALGFAMYQPSDIQLMPEEQLLDKICVSLGGRAAERIFFDSVTTGASDDLDKVTKMAYAMVTQFGFSKKIGQVNYQNMSDGYNKPYSEQTGRDIDDEVRRIIDEQWDRTIKLLESKKDILGNLANVLLEKETIERTDLLEVLGDRPWKEMTTYEEYVHGTGSMEEDTELPEGLKDWDQPTDAEQEASKDSKKSEK